MPKRIVLDTSAYSWLRNGHLGVRAWVRDAETVYLPAIVLGELRAGFQWGSRTAENLRALDELLGQPFVSVLDVTQDVGARYGEVLAALRRQGTPIPVNDLWIAATTLEAGAHLVSFDAHFAQVAGLSHTIMEPPGTS